MGLHDGDPRPSFAHPSSRRNSWRLLGRGLFAAVSWLRALGRRLLRDDFARAATSRARRGSLVDPPLGGATDAFSASMRPRPSPAPPRTTRFLPAIFFSTISSIASRTVAVLLGFSLPSGVVSASPRSSCDRLSRRRRRPRTPPRGSRRARTCLKHEARRNRRAASAPYREVDLLDATSTRRIAREAVYAFAPVLGTR